MDKTCSKCKEAKPISEFHKKDKTRYRSTCKLCTPKPPVSDWRRNVKKRLVAIAGSKCVDCGYEGPPFMYDFDHRDPNEKSFGIGRFRYGLDKMSEEVTKCDLVCVMCHRIRTHKQRCTGCEYC